jgi:Leucine-rich repeat (LRR) protein
MKMFCLKHLKYLNILNSKIIPSFYHNYQFPSQIENLAASLTLFTIINTKVTHLPQQIGKLKNLTHLEMRNTSLIDLPDSIHNLTQLEFLRLDQNNLISLPKIINNLELLNMIILDDNPHFRSLQSLNGMKKLRHIHAKNCLIDRLPYDMPNLEGLMMRNNSLKDLYGIETLRYNTKAKKLFEFNSNHLKFYLFSI